MTGESIPECLKTCTLDTDYATWFPTMGAVLLTVVLGISVVYMISRALGRKDWEALARTELYHTGIAAVWVIIIAAAATAACSTSCSITSDQSPFDSALSYISGVRGGLQDNSINLMEKAKEIRIKTAIQIGFINGFIGPWGGCDSVAGNYETYSTILAPFIGSLIFQQYALILVNNIAFQFLLPLGVILRLIPFLRESGAFVMALAFALYIVLPLTYVMADKATAGITYTPSETGSGVNCVAPDTAFSIMQNIGFSLPQAVFFPALSSIITIAAARSLSKVFKYDFQEIL